MTQGKHLFEYAVIRIVPHVEREEFINVGIILYCPAESFLKAGFELNENRLKALCNDLDIDQLKEHLSSFERISEGGENAGSVGKLSMPERFRWLTATRSTVVQTSPVHPGLCDDAEATFTRLYEKLVGN